MNGESPAGAGQRIEQLSPAKRALLRRMLAGQQREHVVPRSSTGPAPLSPAQQRLWFLDQLEPGNPFYNICVVVRLTGDVQPQLLEQALRRLVKRHGALRTQFLHTPDGPAQLERPIAEWQLEQVDLTHIPVSKRQEETRRLAGERSTISFCLTSDCLFRATLLKFARDEHFLILVIHHIVCDGWSIGIMLQELGQLYDARVEGRPDPLPHLGIAYTDFAEWHRAHDVQTAYARELQYWMRTLGDDHTPLELPMDRPRSPSPTYRAAGTMYSLSADETRRVDQFAVDHQCTPYVVFLSAWQCLLARYAQQSRIRVGVPVANRHPIDTEPLVGLFINTLVVQCDVLQHDTFRQFVETVRKSLLEALDHQHIPFERIVEQLQPERDLSHAPLVQNLCVMQKALDTSALRSRLQITDIDVSHNPSAAYDLTLNIVPHSGGYQLLLVHNTDRIDTATAHGMLESLTLLLRSAIDDPDQQLWRLPIVSDEQREVLLEQWNGTARALPEKACVHDLFHKVAQRHPRTPAIQMDNESVTYGDLDRLSTNISLSLGSLGAGRGNRVGICLPRGPRAVLAMLGVLKSGAAFLPLDPQLPDNRLHWMCRDAEVPWVITEPTMAARLECDECRVLDLNPLLDSSAQSDKSLPPRRTLHDDPAYLIYTSGSTGAPKAVELTHGGWINHTLEMARQLQLAPGEACMQCLSLGFDASLEEIFPALVTGTTIVMHSRPREITREELRDFCTAHAIRHVHLLPALFEPMVQSLSPEDRTWLCRLKSMVIGGDRVAPQTMSDWCDLTGGCVPTFFVYGVTEATIGNTLFRIPSSWERDRTVPIGRPLANQRVYVLDDYGQLVPPGVVGELCIGGIGVGRGYVGRPEWTAERFVADPFVSAPGARMYRTGDRARWRADGLLEYIGRNDQQLKIRGYRIEAGEIESALLRHPDVLEAKVTSRRDRRGHTRLVAYVVARPESTPTGDALREHLRTDLPHYMVPTAWVFLDELPKRVGGKIDYRALPEPAWPTVERAQRHAASLTPRELQLIAIWKQLLDVPSVGPDDNFFALGGDSILTLQLVAEAAKAGLQITPKQVFLYQTAAELAQVAGDRTTAATCERFSGDMPLTPVQSQFFHTTWSNPHHFNQAILLAVAPAVPFDVLSAAWRHVASRHSVLASRFVERDGKMVQRYDSEAPVPPLEYVQLRPNSSTDARDRVREIASRCHARLNIYEGPVVAACYMDLGPDQSSRLFLVMHHLVVDAVSWRIVVDELQVACQQLLQHHSVELPAIGHGFWQWSSDLWEKIDDWRILRHRELWRDWELGQDRSPHEPQAIQDTVPAGENAICAVRECAVSLDEATTELLLGTAQGAYRTRVDEFLIAALMAAMVSNLGRRWVRLDVEFHGRESLGRDRDWSRTVGWFTSIVPVQFELPLDVSASSIIPAVKDQLRSYTRCVPAFGILRWVTRDPAIVHRFPSGLGSDISFNYLGRLSSPGDTETLLSLADELSVSMIDPVNRRWHALEVLAFVRNSRMHVTMTYDARRFANGAIQQLATSFERHLRAFVSACGDKQIGDWTRSDFPLAQFDEHDFRAVLATLSTRRTPDGARALAELEDLYRLTPTQRLMLLHCVAHPSDRQMIQHFSCTITGPLHTDRLHEAWHDVVARHAVFRTGFIWQGVDSPYQFVLRQAPLDWREHDLSHLPQREADRRAEEIELEFRGEPLEVRVPPLLRVLLMRVAQNRCRLVWSCHHLVLDGWSLPIVLRDLFALYQARCNGRSADMPAVHRFRDYVGWLAEQDVRPAEVFWHEMLRGAAPIALPRRVGSTPAQWHEVRRVLSEDQAGNVEDFSRNHHLTPTSTLATALAVALAQWRGHRDLVLGLAVAGRPAELAGSDSIVGPLANTVPVRISLSRDQTVLDCVRQLHQRIAELPSHEHTPLDDIARWGGAAPGIRMFDTLLVLENYPMSTARFADAELRLEDCHGTATSAFPITVVVVPGEPWEVRVRSSDSVLSFQETESFVELFVQAIQNVLHDTARMLDMILQDQTEKLAFDRDIDADTASCMERLSSHTLVHDVVVQPWHDAAGRPSLVAYVVPTADAQSVIDTDGRTLLHTTLHEYVNADVGGVSLPVTLVIVASLARDAQGTVQFDQLPPPRLPRSRHAPPCVPPRNATEQKLVELWSDLLRIEPLGIHDRFMELGGDSSMAVTMLGRMEQAFGCKLPIVTLFHDPTIEELAERVSRPVQADVASILVPLRSSGSRAPIFCVHPAGGTVFCYLNLAKHLPGNQPTFGVQAVGIDGTKPPRTDVVEMAAEYVEAIRAQQPAGPYSLCGWSSGGILAYEMARQLAQLGERVRFLALFDAAISDGAAEFTQDDFLAMMTMMFPGDTRETLQQLQGQPIEEQLEFFRNRAELAQLVVAGAANSQVRHVYEVFQANVHAMANYCPQPYEGEMHLFRTRSASTPMHRHRTLGWHALVNKIHVHDVEGDHVSMFSEPYVQELAYTVGRLLQNACGIAQD